MKDQILQKLLEYLQNTEDFVLEQVPEIIQQVLRYEIISTYMGAGILLFIIILCIGLNIYLWKYSEDTIKNTITSSIIYPISSIALPFLFIQFCCLIDKLVKIYIAPKYFLIDLILNMKK